MASRASLAYGGRVDQAASFAYPKAWEARKRHLVRALQCGGVWSDLARYKAGMATTDCCAFCGEPRADTFH
eukprot:5837204-Alexandrium_andersonii.AAC.1